MGFWGRLLHDSLARVADTDEELSIERHRTMRDGQRIAEEGRRMAAEHKQAARKSQSFWDRGEERW